MRTKRPPCIVCGKRKHDPVAHEEHRRERRRCANLLRKTWPRLKGLPAVLAWCAKRTPPRIAPPEPRPLDWRCKVLSTGEVIHVPVWPEPEPDA